MPDTVVDFVVHPGPKGGRLDRENAAKYLGLSKKTLELWAVMGQGPGYVKRGRVWYFRNVLDDWLENGDIAKAKQSKGSTQ